MCRTDSVLLPPTGGWTTSKHPSVEQHSKCFIMYHCADIHGNMYTLPVNIHSTPAMYVAAGQRHKAAG